MKKIVGIILLVSLGLSISAVAQTQGPEKELKNINLKITHLQSHLKQDISSQAQLQEYLKQLDQQIAFLNKESAALNTQLHNDQLRLDALQKTRAEQELQLNHERALLALQLDALYRLSPTNTLKIIFTPNNLTAVDRHLYYFHYLNEARTKILRNIDLSIEHLNQNLASVQDEQRQLSNNLERKKMQEQILQNAELARRQLLSKLTESIEAKQIELSHLIANQQVLEDTIAKLHQQAAMLSLNHLTFSQYQGKLKWPLSGSVTPTYGHYFVLIKNPQELRVKAIFPGKVIFANWLRGFGFLVIINHGSGYMSLYGRNEALYAKVGDNVAAGDVIASLAQTSKADKPPTPANLYFEIRHDGHALDPHVWCS